MNDTTMRVSAFTLQEASEREYTALNNFNNRMSAERLPDHPPMTVEDLKRRCRNTPSSAGITQWVVWSNDGSTIVARGKAFVTRLAKNERVVRFIIEVLPEYRHEGLVQALLAQLATVAQHDDRQVMLTEILGRHPVGETFISGTINLSQAPRSAVEHRIPPGFRLRGQVRP